MAEDLNQLIKSRNNAADDYNKVAKSYNQKYGHGLEFNQGEYTQGNINIYQFDSPNSLRMVLAHELGHALELEHLDNPEAIMYRLNESGSDKITADDITALKKACKIK